MEMLRSYSLLLIGLFSYTSLASQHFASLLDSAFVHKEANKLNALCEIITSLEPLIKEATSTQLADFHFLSGRCYQHQYDSPNTIQSYEVALDRYNKNKERAGSIEKIMEVYYYLATANRNIDESKRLAFLDSIENCWQTEKRGAKSLVAAQLERSTISATKRDYSKAIEYAQKAIQYHEENDVPKLGPKAFAHFRLAIAYNALAKKDAAFHNLYEAARIYKQERPDNPQLSLVYNTLGNSYARQKQYQQAIEAYKMAIEINKKHQGENAPALRHSYGNLANVYRTIGAYFEAKPAYERAIDITIRSRGENAADLRHFYANYGGLLKDLEAYEPAKTQLKKAIHIYLEHFGDTHPGLVNPYNMLGLIARIQGEFEQSMDYFQQALQVIQNQDKPSPYRLATLHNSIGRTYQEQQKHKLAIQYFEQAKQFISKEVAEYDPANSRYCYNIAKSNLALEQVQEGFENNKNALELVGFRATQPISFDSINDLWLARSILSQQAELYIAQYDKTLDIKVLEASNQYYQYALQTTDYLREQFREDGSKQIQLEQAFKIYEAAIATLHRLYRITNKPDYARQAFSIAERSKNQRLLDLILQDKLIVQTLPDSVVQAEREMRTAIRQLEQDLTQASSDSLENVLFELKYDYTNLVSEMQRNYPGFYQALYEQKALYNYPIPDNIAPKTALIEYFIGDSSLVIFTIYNNELWFDSTPIDATFHQLITNYRKLLINPNATTKLQGLAQQLYKILLAPAFEHLPNDVQRLSIVPAETLNLLPFETLMRPTSTTARYLIQDYAIHYLSSSRLLAEHKKSVNYQRGFIGIAPSYDINNWATDSNVLSTPIVQLVRSGKLPLPGAIQEVEAISELLNGDKLLDKAATKANFLQEAPNYGVLHLSMHTLVDDAFPLNSSFLFTQSQDSIDTALTAGELYNLPLHAQLAVLSACETGYGNIERGEGIMSLSRAFAAAGVPALVNSLWKVPDDATADIMLAFYQNLQKGTAKDEALRNAKLQYLENALSTQQQHPYFWAGFVASGDMQPIQLNKHNAWKWLVGILFIVFGIFSILWRIIRTQTNNWRRI